MNEIWAKRLIAGTKTWAEMPVSRKNAVDSILKKRVVDNEITADKYKEITGNEYTA